MNIYIVDDDTSILNLFTRFFNLCGFNVIGTAKNGEEAVVKFKNFSIKPDITIMDYLMPIKNGIEATKNILEFDKSAKIIIISADMNIKREAFFVGAIDFINKPINLKCIYQKIIYALKDSEFVKTELKDLQHQINSEC